MEVMLNMVCMKSLATVTAMFSYCHCWVICFSVLPFKMSQSLFHYLSHLVMSLQYSLFPRTPMGINVYVLCFSWNLS